MTSVQDNPPTIMIVEDDERLADLTCEYLQSNGLDVSVVSDGEEAIRRIRSEQPDLVVLDLMLPGADGLTVCREVRATFKNPILMLTARTDDMDQVLGLEMGADDYVAKPVKPRVLLARIRALLRRVETDSERDSSPSRLEFGALVIDNSAREVSLRGKSVDLTSAEYDLLWLLLPTPARCCPARPSSRNCAVSSTTARTAPSTCAFPASGPRSATIRKTPSESRRYAPRAICSLRK